MHSRICPYQDFYSQRLFIPLCLNLFTPQSPGNIMDTLDKSILAELQKDAKLSMQDLADRVHSSSTQCWRRVRQLQEQGVILGYQAKLDSRAMGLHAMAYIHIALKDHGEQSVKDFLHIVETNDARTFADGVACRMPNPQAMELIKQGVERFVEVSDAQVAEAIRILYTDTPNVAEGAGATALAALLADAASNGPEQFAGRPVAVIQTGGNIDADMLAEVLEGGTPGV